MGIRATAVIFEENKLLMVHRLRDGNDYYVLPGGSVEEGEDPEKAVLRELKEETSIEAKLQNKLFDFVDHEGRNHQLFLCEYISGVPKLAEGSVEIDKTTADNTYEPMWVEKDKLSSITIWPEQTKKLLILFIKDSLCSLQS